METPGAGAVGEGKGCVWAAHGAGSTQDTSRTMTGVHGQAARSIIHNPLHHRSHGAMSASAGLTKPNHSDSSAYRGGEDYEKGEIVRACRGGTEFEGRMQGRTHEILALTRPRGDEFTRSIRDRLAQSSISSGLKVLSITQYPSRMASFPRGQRKS
jgi:hypothetical protein